MHLNAQQISIQQVVYLTLSIPLYHSTRSFQFINTCQQQDKTFVLLPQKKYDLSLSFTKLHCKSLVDKYINWNEKLNDFCLVEFVANYDIKVNKRCSKRKIIR